MQKLVSKEHKWTLVVVSNDPLVMASCDRVLILKDGSIAANGKFSDLMQQGLLENNIE
jgi:ABC-type protease/lipase transport system fused ATPase/permease subunit